MACGWGVVWGMEISVSETVPACYLPVILLFSCSPGVEVLAEHLPPLQSHWVDHTHHGHSQVGRHGDQKNTIFFLFSVFFLRILAIFPTLPPAPLLLISATTSATPPPLLPLPPSITSTQLPSPRKRPLLITAKVTESIVDRYEYLLFFFFY